MSHVMFMLVNLLVAPHSVLAFLRKVGTDPALGGNIKVIGGVGSGVFEPTKIYNWLPDARSPIIAAASGGTCPDAYGNIYNPTVVNTGVTSWNIYYGGWDGVRDCKDSVSMTMTEDTFATFGPHVPTIKTGNTRDVNNPNAIKVNRSFWVMMYTQASNVDHLNKPGLSFSTSGMDWTPSEGTNTTVSVDRYPYNWGNATVGADVNGGNVLLLDESTNTWHFWFTDFKQIHSQSVFHATCPRNKLGEFIFEGVALPEPNRIVNDIKMINGFYMLAMHCNGGQTFYSVSRNAMSFPPSKVLFNHTGPADTMMVSIGLVVDTSSTRLLGALYGAGCVSGLGHNRLFAKWLQKRVLFISNDGNNTTWGNEAYGHGPDSQILTASSSAREDGSSVGKFYVFDSDYTDVNNRGTLLYTSEEVTVMAGDVWQYSQDEMQTSVDETAEIWA